MAERLLLLRHGRVVPPGPAPLVGATDLALTAEGLKQVRALALWRQWRSAP